MLLDQAVPAGIDRDRIDGLGEALEGFARDLLVLCKTFSVYPQGHPAPLRMAERLSKWFLPGTTGDVSVGVTPSKLFVEEHFFGAKDSRAEAIASYLHARKVMRVIWTSRVQTDDVLAFARVLATRGLKNADLRAELRAANVFSIDVDPLDVGKIHGAVSTQKLALDKDSVERGREAWLWLQDDTIQPDGIASVLHSGSLWEAGEKEATFIATLLFQHAHKLDEALFVLPEESRQKTLAQFGKLGKALSVVELAKIIDREARRGNLDSKSLSGLLGELETETLVDIMAAVVARGSGSTERVASIFRFLAPKGELEGILPLVEARFSPGGSRGFALEIWNVVESFLLNLKEEKFFGDDYYDSLNNITQREPEPSESDDLAEFKEDPEIHVDWMYFGLARDQGGDTIPKLLDRVRARVSVLPVSQLLMLVLEIDRTMPGAFRGEPKLVRQIFSKLISNIRVLDRAEQWAAIELARAHETSILDVALTALLKEQRLAGRRFLVELLSSLSAASTPEMIARACNAPWYFVRNVATVLGCRKERTNASILQALLDHPHKKVRREAMKSLGALGAPAKRVLEEFAGDIAKNADDRRLARTILHRMGSK